MLRLAKSFHQDVLTRTHVIRPIHPRCTRQSNYYSLLSLQARLRRMPSNSPEYLFPSAEIKFPARDGQPLLCPLSAFSGGRRRYPRIHYAYWLCGCGAGFAIFKILVADSSSFINTLAVICTVFASTSPSLFRFRQCTVTSVLY